MVEARVGARSEAAPPPAPPLLEMKSVTKRFPGVLANDAVDLTLRAGEVHALLGENGAGKTTLISILYGLYTPDEGEIRLSGRPTRFRSPKDAMRAGIGLVAQHFTLSNRHTVAENVALGLSTSFFFPTRRVAKRVAELGERYGLAVDPQAEVWRLSAGEKQRVEIVKALVHGAKILILDEPTSVLTPGEAEGLFGVLEGMKRKGHAVVFISHKLGEVMRVADAVTVLRKGAVVGSLRREEASLGGLAELMVGRNVVGVKNDHAGVFGEPVLRVRDLCVAGDGAGREALSDVTFSVREGEILGVAGVAGNGQRELIGALTGLRRPISGRVELGGRDVTRSSPAELFGAGVAHIPEDRNHTGVVPAFSVLENLMLRGYREPPLSRGPLLNYGAAERAADEAVQDYAIATPSLRTPTRLLSGGNVQKVILARELAGSPKLVVAAHPTYGLDVGAAERTHKELLKKRAAGAGVLLVSEDLEELLLLADRIMVLFGGRVMGVLPGDADREKLGLMMAGVT